MENFGKPLHIPEDITNKILIQLPSKSLLRFTLVSKSWMNHIQSQEFIHSHIKHNSKKRTQLIFTTVKYPILYELREAVNDEVDELKSTITSTAPTQLRKHQIIGHCNGMICLTTKIKDGTAILLWNPALRQCRRIRVPSSSYNTIIDLAGFWYDCKNQDYKVLLFPIHSMTMRYSLKMNTWQQSRSRTTSTFDSSGVSSDCLCFEGNLHWTFWDGVMEHVGLLVVFNLADEKYATYAMPTISPDAGITGPKLGVFRGRLSFVRRRFQLVREEFEIWSTHDPSNPNSWIKVLSISPVRLSLKTPFLRAMGLVGWRSESFDLTPDGRVLVELSRIPNSASNVGLLLNGKVKKKYAPVNHGFNFTECALLYDGETHQLEVYKDGSDYKLKWCVITDYVESFVSVQSNPWWGKVGNFFLSQIVVDVDEVPYLLLILIYTFVSVIVISLVMLVRS